MARVDFHRQKFRIQGRADRNILADEPADQGFGFAHHRIEIHEARLNDLLPAEREQLAGQLRGPLRGVQNLLGLAWMAYLAARPHPTAFAVADDDHQQIVEIVRYATRQAANRLHLAGLMQLLLGPLEILDVRADAKPSHDIAAMVAHRKSAREKPAIFAFLVAQPELGFVCRAGSNGIAP